MEVGEAYLSIIPSARGFAGTLQGQLGGIFTQAGSQGGTQLASGVEASAGSKMKGAGLALAGGLIAGFVAAGASQITQAVTQWVGDAIGLASGLEQSVGGVDAIFKENADTIHEWAAGAAEDLGLSQNAYNELATVIGAQLKNTGMEMDEVTSQTGSLVEMGADLAAQFGGSTADAVSALSSLLRGERDPIERYGVSINQAAIEAKKAELGLSDLTGEAERNADIQATLALLTEQTADAQGAFARESDTLAGQQARLNAEFENMQTEVGTALLPVVSELFGLFKETGLPLLRSLVDWITNNQDAITTFGSAIATFGLGFADVMLGLGRNVSMASVVFIDQIRAMWNFFSSFVQGILDGAVEAFGWVPGLGPKLENAADDFRTFSGDVDGHLAEVQTSAYQMGSAFEDAQGLVGSLSDAINNIPSQKNVTINVTERGTRLVSRSDGTYSYGGGMDARAGGGPVVAGRPYIVGEYEPELFVPDVSGQIYNQSQLAAMAGYGGTGGGVTQYIYPQPGQSEQAIGDAAARVIRFEMAGGA